MMKEHKIKMKSPYVPYVTNNYVHHQITFLCVEECLDDKVFRGKKDSPVTLA